MLRSASDGTPIESRPIIRAGRALVEKYVRGYHTLTALGPCTLPPSGPAILVCNHISGLDPVLLQVLCPRVVAWMMAQEYYDIAPIHWALRLIGCIPVQRSGHDLAATRAALRALESGRIVGVFPEGRISTGPNLLPFQTGVGHLAIRSGAAVFVARIDGSMRGQSMTEAFMFPQHARIRFGPEVQFDRMDLSDGTVRSAALAIQDAVDALRPDKGDSPLFASPLAFERMEFRPSKSRLT